MDFLKLVRFPNLIIIIVIQYTLQYWILRPALLDAEINLLLTHNLFFLLVVSTVLIGATGYIINDIVDVEIDKVNKPHSMIVDRVISIKHAWQIYWSLVIIGFVISLYVAVRINNIPLVLIYPSAIALLALYSFILKRKVFIGNLVVALFSALVTGIILFAERASFADLKHADLEGHQFISLVFFGYIFFSILTSIYREIVKDIEDVEGDKSIGCETLPTVFGTKPSKTIALVFALLTLLMICFWALKLIFAESYLTLIGVGLFVTLPLIYSVIKLKQASKPTDYHHVSTCIKIVMAGGIICLFLL